MKPLSSHSQKDKALEIIIISVFLISLHCLGAPPSHWVPFVFLLEPDLRSWHLPEQGEDAALFSVGLTLPGVALWE